MAPHRTTVLRDGVPPVVNSIEIVPGDIVTLVSGDKVPADIHLQNVQELEIDEFMLTGVSVAIEKDANTASSDAMPLVARRDAVYAGTI